jgi:hypothetical protein
VWLICYHHADAAARAGLIIGCRVVLRRGPLALAVVLALALEAILARELIALARQHVAPLEQINVLRMRQRVRKGMHAFSLRQELLARARNA